MVREGAERARIAIERLLSPFQRFAETESSGGIVLLACTALALVWANSPVASSYSSLWHTPVALGTGGARLTLSLGHWIGDALMAVFFLLVGLEIKREFLFGELSSARTAALPLAAALGGMLVPAAIYVLFNAGGPGASGWGIPMATDIAFALGILALLGPRVPVSLKVFLAALAIADDIGAVLVIAVFYTATLSLPALGVAAGVVALAALANRAGVRSPLAYGLIGVPLWVAVHASGIHATIAGVLLAATVPARPRPATEAEAPLHRMERALHPWVAFAIVPLFALASAGVRLGGAGVGTGAITWGVLLGLLLGKPIGILGATWVALRMGAAPLAGVGWRALHGVSWLGGIGFTMSLFVAQLAFDSDDALAAAKLGILGASAVAAVVGWVLLRTLGGPERRDRSQAAALRDGAPRPAGDDTPATPAADRRP